MGMGKEWICRDASCVAYCEGKQCVHSELHEYQVKCNGGGFCPGCIKAPEDQINENKAKDYIELKGW